MQAGLNENDLLVEVNNENVEGKSSRGKNHSEDWNVYYRNIFL